MRLYHYTNSDSVIKILISEKIKFTLIDDLNDPFEFCFDSDGVNINHETFKKILRKQSALFCCSKSPEKNLYSLEDLPYRSPHNILMLSHYADKHKGWVIEFEFNKDHSNKNVVAIDVGYDIPIPSFGNFLKTIEEQSLLKSPEKLKELVARFIHNIVARKDRSWAYENETRLLLSNPQDKNTIMNFS